MKIFFAAAFAGTALLAHAAGASQYSASGVASQGVVIESAPGVPMGTPGNPTISADAGNAAFAGFIGLSTDGAAYSAGRAFEAECTAAGNVKITATDGSTRTVPLNVGLSILPYAVTSWTLAGVTGAATCTYANLK